MKILLIDDDPVVRILVGEYLTTKGHQVETRNDGPSGIESLAQPNNTPDVVIVDYMMPGMTGVEVLKNMRSSNATLPIVMLSADKKNFDEGTQQANLTLEKPFALDTLEQKLQELTK